MSSSGEQKIPSWQEIKSALTTFEHLFETKLRSETPEIAAGHDFIHVANEMKLIDYGFLGLGALVSRHPGTHAKELGLRTLSVANINRILDRLTNLTDPHTTLVDTTEK